MQKIGSPRLCNFKLPQLVRQLPGDVAALLSLEVYDDSFPVQGIMHVPWQLRKRHDSPPLRVKRPGMLDNEKLRESNSRQQSRIRKTGRGRNEG